MNTDINNISADKAVENQPEVEVNKEANKEIESIINFTFNDLRDAGVHFGHKLERTNRKMMPYIFEQKDGMYIINLGKTIPLFKNALAAIRKHVANSRNGRVLFVGTQHQSRKAVKDAAKQCAQYSISEKWPGGLLTNWKTVSQSIKRMKDTEKKLEDGFYNSYKKHEQVKIQKKHDKQAKLFEGIRDMSDLPSLIIITSHNETNAIKEAKKLNIPIVLLLDTDGDPQGIDFPVPGNDDSIISVDLFCTLCSRAGLLGIHDEQEVLKRKEEAKKKKEEEKQTEKIEKTTEEIKNG
ncbi:30S ribosomal protein S2 [Candidatus Cytomitobacter primus]|uniref:30S ribosomal protein S2 n=1 Tax=Candidatus Cytomitobacter primus TaxID=2066024 RepID=UPI00165343E8|nr:30S ribosomal protein S2 [Candidatus Cytomitobacter primus]